mmetsp:Transcript_12609/g.41458  ORF Transcript_12609/g.41458 Transcript_12609/m.41458 type:complete len:236 (+) Transcript_12609:126-833(+)
MVACGDYERPSLCACASGGVEAKALSVQVPALRLLDYEVDGPSELSTRVRVDDPLHRPQRHKRRRHVQDAEIAQNRASPVPLQVAVTEHDPPQPLPPKAPVDLAAAAECLKVVSSSEQVRIARRYLHFPQVAAHQVLGNGGHHKGPQRGEGRLHPVKFGGIAGGEVRRQLGPVGRHPRRVGVVAHDCYHTLASHSQRLEYRRVGGCEFSQIKLVTGRNSTVYCIALDPQATVLAK